MRLLTVLVLAASCGSASTTPDASRPGPDAASSGGAGGAAVQGGSGGSPSGGSGGNPSGGSGGTGGGPDAAADRREPDAAPTDAAPAGSRCGAGPFPAPNVESMQSVCGSFAFNFNYNEGPTWVAAQNAFYFSNFVARTPTGGDIIKYTPGGQCEFFVTGVGCNGLAVSTDGRAIFAACHQSRSVIRFDLATKQPTTVTDAYMGRMLDTPNDLVVHSNGSLYFTNPDFELAGRPAGIGRAVFRIDPAGALSMVAMTIANGIALSPDERRLYALGGGIWDLDAAGVPSNRRDLFVGGDGMAVDCGGNVYASGTIFTAQGQRLGNYGGGTNLAFGGPDGKTLLVVGPGNNVRALRMNLPGLP
jgi:gluconolactonase